MTRITKFIILTCIITQLLSCAILQKQTEQEHISGQTNCNQQASVLFEITRIFREFNPKIDVVALVDVCQKNLGADEYVVLAWGIRGDRTFDDSFSDELFGLFIIDKSFTTVMEVLDIIPTKRWNDYTMRIEKLMRDKVILVGEGTTHGDNRFFKEYNLFEE